MGVGAGGVRGGGGEEKAEDERGGGKGQGSVWCSISVLLNIIIFFSFEFADTVIILMNVRAFRWFTKDKNLWAQGHSVIMQTQLTLGPSPLSGAFLLLILNHIALHNIYLKWSYPFLPLSCLLPLFDSQKNPANVFKVLWCIIYQTGCWYEKRTRREKENGELKKGVKNL